MKKRPQTKEAVDYIIDEWHMGRIDEEYIHNALGWTWEEYEEWVANDKIPE